MVSLSVCVCTYNRAESLRAMLESIKEQRGAPPFELIVVDNNSTDHTREVVQGFSTLPVRYARETRQGLSHARNCALREFRGDYLLFLDDDVRLAPECCSAYRNAIAAFPQADCFGGRILPDWKGTPPAWVGERLPLLDGLLVWLDLGEATRPFAEDEAGPFGASFALSRRLIASVGEFHAELGCKGEGRGRGEETEWFGRAMQLGAQRIYVGDALCYHRVDPARLSLARLFEYGVESGIAHRHIAGEDRDGSLFRLLGFALRGVLQLAKGRGDRFRQCVINMGIEYDALRH